MERIFHKLLDKYTSGQNMTISEIHQLDVFLNDLNYREKLNDYYEQSWQNRKSVPVDIHFDEIWTKFRHNSIYSTKKRFLMTFAKIASILFIPLLVASIYLYSNRTFSEDMLTLSTQKGEFTSIILPDGSKVWLNVDSKLKYPVSYGLNTRSFELEGEAYFEVEENIKIPFEITAGGLTTKVFGTRFAISAYPESSEIKTSLIEGSVEVKYLNNSVMLKPGQQITVNQNMLNYTINTFDEKYELGWKDNQLIFQLTPFDKVIDILEKWYDISIDYDPDLFKTEIITVRFGHHETLENILLVLSRASGFSYSVTNNNIKIIKI